MIKNKKQMYIIIGVFVLALMLFTTTYAFFNYTRTGSRNTIRTGRIAFNTQQGKPINLTNVFPIDVTNGVPNNDSNVGSVTINVTGDTTYDEGIEYLVRAVNVQNSVGNKSLPISIDVDYTANGQGKSIGEDDEDYYENRGGNSSLYKVLADDTFTENEKLVVGYIAKGQTGIDGNINIKAYLDKDKIAISDTYPNTEDRAYVLNPNMTSEMIETCSEYMIYEDYSSWYLPGESMTTFCDGTGTLYGYTFNEWILNNIFNQHELAHLKNDNIIVDGPSNGTTNEWVDGRMVFTTEEWNSLQQNGISFQVKVEANEGIWVVPTDINCFTANGDTITGYDVSCGGTNVYIPEKINNVTITTIGAMAFWDKNLTSVNIPDTVTTINSMAFQSNKITKVHLGHNVEEIGVRAFSNNLITSLVLPDSVTHIGSYAFYNNRMTGNLIIPSGMETINEHAFNKGGNFTNVTIPNSNITFGSYVFEDSTIENLSIDVPLINSSSFKEAGITNLTLGNHVETIDNYAFENNNISTLTIPSSVKNIYNSFQHNHIANVTIPSTVETLSCYAFAYQTDSQNSSITTNITYEQSGFTCAN